MTRLLKLLLESVSLYLPVILMGVLALGTYWLVRSTPLLLPTDQQQSPKHEVDYFMHNFSVKTFDTAGRLKSEVYGTDARHYQDTDSLEIDAVRIRSFDAGGRLTTATAGRAITKGDASEVELIGSALVVREPEVSAAGTHQARMEFRSEFLRAYIETERLESNKPVVLTHGRDRFTADRLDYDNRNRVILLTGRVKGFLASGFPN
jgi:lipopolysaccharide export system protein LptC